MGKALRALAANKCTDVIFAGRVGRPRFTELRLDVKGALVMPRLAAAALKGTMLCYAVLSIYLKRKAIAF